MRGFKGMQGVNIPLGFQSHHILPVGVFGHGNFARCFAVLRGDGFDPSYFPFNGMLLPATEPAAVIHRLPLHRGPHRRYNELVAQRVSTIMRDLECRNYRFSARLDAVQRLQLLTGTLRHMLTGRARSFCLNRRDPMNASVSFAHVEAACDALWPVTI